MLLAIHGGIGGIVYGSQVYRMCSRYFSVYHISCISMIIDGMW